MYANTKLSHLELYTYTSHFDIYTVYSEVDFGVKLFSSKRSEGKNIPELK